jgi:hypothetical protein
VLFYKGEKRGALLCALPQEKRLQLSSLLREVSWRLVYAPAGGTSNLDYKMIPLAPKDPTHFPLHIFTYLFILAVPEFELRACSLSHSASPVL